MKKTLFLMSKPWCKKQVANNFSKEESESNFGFYFLNEFERLKFDYPKKIKRGSLPFTGDPQFKFNYLGEGDEKYNHQHPVKSFSGFKSMIDQYGEVVLFGEGHSFFFCAIQLLLSSGFDGCLSQKSKFSVIYADEIIKTEGAFNKAMSERKILSESSKAFKAYRFGVAKRYFEYNFNVNSNALIRKHLKDKSATMTKYALMALFVLQENQEDILSYPKLINLFGDWRGSGKYSKNKELNDCLIGIGQASSRDDILRYLEKQELIKICENKTSVTSRVSVKLTNQGHAFLNKLHRRTYDPDLPFRIHLWSQEYSNGDDVTLNYIDAYLNRLFKRLLSL